MDQTLSH